ncbi:MAG TPA: hypothetical protein VNA28_16850 [Solirubrobacteraceae bacterium]|nr:hypothetical protein [Solirubrobacteraceae bacterium]
MKVTMKAALIAGLALLLMGGSVAGAARLITGAQIKNSSITGTDIKNRSLTAADFRGSVAGPAGPTGPAGPAGPAGPTVVNGLTRVAGPAVAVAGFSQGQSTATCPAGQGVVKGGFITSGAGSVASSDSFGAANSWTVNLDNLEAPTGADVQAIAYCAPSGQAVSPR